VGKSQLLREVFSSHAQEITGYIVQRLTINNNTAGFKAACINDVFPLAEAVYTPDMKGVFIFQGQWDVSVLEDVVLQVEEETKKNKYKMILLDEIGGIELGSHIFMDSLKRILSGAMPCCGVFKSFENLKHTAAMLKLQEEYMAYNRELAAYLIEAGELLTVTEQNHVETRDYLAARFHPLF
jgi:nucleoside-triphosphatase THEP1